MLHYLIVCRSLTYAQRAAKVLERAGITAIVMRPPAEITGEGCMYCVKVSEKRISQALITLKNAGLSRESVYMMDDDGHGREVSM